MDNTPTIMAVSADYGLLEAALVDSNGSIIQVESSRLGAAAGGGGRSYMDPGSLFDIAARTIRGVLERKPREARRIAGAAIIGRSPSVAAVGPDGPVGAFPFPDLADAKAFEGVCWDDVCDAVGLTRMRCEIPLAMRSAPTDASATYLTPKDYLKWALTGECSTDPLDAQRTFLWDLAKREWSAELCRIFGVDINRLPPVKNAGEPAGNITPEAARATGLKAGLPVACGMGDWGEYLGTGAFDDGDAFEHIGSTGAFYGITGIRPSSDLGLEIRPHVLEDRYLVGREGLPGGTCLEWLLKKSYFVSGGEIDWPAVDEEFEAIAAMGRPENVLFFPALGGGEGQISDAAFTNMHIEDDLTSLIQGSMEGLFFNLKAVADEIRVIGWEPRAIYTTGQVGFKHAPRRTRANIYGHGIYAGRTPGANVTSAALAGAVACGIYKDIEEARQGMLNIDGGVAPVEEVRRLYEAHYASWLGSRNFLAPQR